MTAQEIQKRITELSGQLVKLDSRTKLDSKASAVAKRRAKIMKDIETLKSELPEAQLADRRKLLLLALM